VRPAPRPAIAEWREPAWLWDMTRHQWLVFLAAWLGWGFDVFDGLLFNFVAPVCVPRLLGVPAGDPRVTAATGAITSTLLVGWATGDHAAGAPGAIVSGRRRPGQDGAGQSSALALRAGPPVNAYWGWKLRMSARRRCC